jgi:hypothetical protein
MPKLTAAIPSIAIKLKYKANSINADPDCVSLRF